MGDAQLTAQMLLLAAVFDAGRSSNKVVKYWAKNKQDILRLTDFTVAEKEYLEQGEFLTPADVTTGKINIGAKDVQARPVLHRDGQGAAVHGRASVRGRRSTARSE